MTQIQAAFIVHQSIHERARVSQLIDVVQTLLKFAFSLVQLATVCGQIASPMHKTLILAACRTFLASAPEVLLAIISTQSRIDFEGYGATFESALCQKAVRRAARRNGVCAATPTEEPLAARRALQPLKPHNASRDESPTRC